MSREKTPDNRFYVCRGVGENWGYTEARHTQFGHTSTYNGLELHIGDHLFRKRGGIHTGFMPDVPDYRYESLLMSLGVHVRYEFVIGCLLGNFYEIGKRDIIRFRISEDEPSDIVVFWHYTSSTYRAIKELRPLGISKAYTGEWLQAVFSLARKNTAETCLGIFDNYYDHSPDAVDLYGLHWSDDLSETQIAETRLRLCGF